jgi:hypothetical protein
LAVEFGKGIIQSHEICVWHGNQDTSGVGACKPNSKR